MLLKYYFILLDVDECTEHPCINNGTCVKYDGSYRCQCIQGWTGQNCEIGMSYLTYTIVGYFNI